MSSFATLGIEKASSGLVDSSPSKVTMMQEAIHLPEQQLPIDEVSSPITAQLLEFCDPELFQETLQNSEITSCSNGYYEENSYTPNLSFPTDLGDKYTDNYDPIPDTTNNTTNSATNLSVILDYQEEIDTNDISAAIDFSASPPFTVPPPFLASQTSDQFDVCSLQPQNPLSDVVKDGISQYPPPNSLMPLMGPPLPPVFEEDCLNTMHTYMRLNPSSPSCSFLDTNPAYLSGNLNSTFSSENQGIFGGNLLMGPELQPQDLEFQGDNGGMFCPESMQRVYNPGDLQAFSAESQQLVNGGGSSTTLAPEMSSLEESTFKVGKLSVEQRKEKIHRYMKKRNERNFSKKIKYACRKTLADSRPRVRGRFAKNDEFGETPRATCSNHDEDDEEDVAVKDEDDMVDTTDIFNQISGMNSFKFLGYLSNPGFD